jgi:hypothetical protein
MTRRPALLAAEAAVCLGVALQISSGGADPIPLGLAALAGALAVGAVLAGRQPGDPAGGSAPSAEPLLPAQLVLGAGVLQGLASHVLLAPGFEGGRASLRGFHALAVLAALVSSAYLCLHLRTSLQKARFWGVLAVFAAMGAAVIHSAPLPQGGVRWIALVAMLVAARAIARLGEGQAGEVAALFLLFQGRTFLVLEQGWTEPLVLAAFALLLLAAVRPPRRTPPGLAVGLALAALLAAMALPFLLPAAAVRPLEGPSLLSRFWRDSGAPAWAGLPAMAAALAVLALGVRKEIRAGQAAAVAAAAWLCFLLLSPQALTSAHWLATGLLCVAVAAHSRAQAATA